MPRFYFHLRQGDKIWIDNQGLDFPGQLEACDAIKAATNALRDRVIADEGLGGEEYEVTDSSGNTLFTVSLS